MWFPIAGYLPEKKAGKNKPPSINQRAEPNRKKEKSSFGLVCLNLSPATVAVTHIPLNAKMMSEPRVILVR